MRDIREDVFEENGEDGLHLEMRRLFGLDPYEEDIEESWDEPPNEPPSKRPRH